VSEGGTASQGCAALAPGAWAPGCAVAGFPGLRSLRSLRHGASPLRDALRAWAGWGHIAFARPTPGSKTGVRVPSMGKIELAEKCQPEEVTTTVPKRNAQP
jgi:hypothetical protein